MKNKLIVIFGASGSGKSTLANDILQYIGDSKAAIISQDYYFHGIKESKTKSFDEPSALDFKLLENHLQALLNNNDIECPIYNFSTHSREKEVMILKPKNIIILDGTMVMTSSLIEKLSAYSIYCDIDIDICFIRRLNRDIKERGRDFNSVVRQYLEEVRPSFFKYINPYKNKCDFFYNEKNKPKLFNNIKDLI